MLKIRAVGIALLTGIAITGAATAAWAQSAGQITAFATAKLSLVQAIDVAERQLSGKAVEAEFETERDSGRYHVQVSKDGEVTWYWVDAGSGQVTKSGRQGQVETAVQVLGGDTVNQAVLDASKTTLVQASDAAEQRIGGKAMRAEVEQERGRLRYGIWVLKGEDRKKVEVDASDGAVKAD
jgi:uncharacterized membrane protein YkoI